MNVDRWVHMKPSSQILYWFEKKYATTFSREVEYCFSFLSFIKKNILTHFFLWILFYFPLSSYAPIVISFFDARSSSGVCKNHKNKLFVQFLCCCSLKKNYKRTHSHTYTCVFVYGPMHSYCVDWVKTLAHFVEDMYWH